MALDAASYPVLWDIYDQTGIRPEYLLPTLWVESGLNPAIQNLQGAPYYGINQVSATWLKTHLGVDPQTYLTWPASEQLSKVVLPFAKAWPKPLLSGTRVEQANYLPATINGAPGWPAARYPGDILVRSNQGEYNPGLDRGNKGYITVADIEAFVSKATPNIQGALVEAYAIRVNEVDNLQDSVIGTDPYLGPNPPPSPTPTSPTQPGGQIVSTTNIGLVIGGSALILGAAGLIAWGLTTTRHAGARENPTRLCPTGSRPVSLLFPARRFSSGDAKAWARSHRFKSTSAKRVGNYVHVPQATGRFDRVRTITLSKRDGVLLRVGWRRC